MMWATVLAAATVLQAKEMALDPVNQRRVYEAWRASERWSERTAMGLYHWKYALSLTPDQRVRYYARQRKAREYLRIASAKQVCEAYSIDRATLNKVVRDPRSRLQKFVDEPIGPGGVKMAVGDLFDMKYPTRFDPSKVVLPAKQAREIGYKNPDPNNPFKPNRAKMYMPDGRRIPGVPRDPEQEAQRREIEKRARDAKIKEVPISTQAPKDAGSGNSVKAP